MSFFFIKYNKYRYIVHFLFISKSITFHETDETKFSTIIIKYQNYSQNEMENCTYQTSHPLHVISIFRLDEANSNDTIYFYRLEDRNWQSKLIFVV